MNKFITFITKIVAYNNAHIKILNNLNYYTYTHCKNLNNINFDTLQLFNMWATQLTPINLCLFDCFKNIILSFHLGTTKIAVGIVSTRSE